MRDAYGILQKLRARILNAIQSDQGGHVPFVVRSNLDRVSEDILIEIYKKVHNG